MRIAFLERDHGYERGTEFEGKYGVFASIFAFPVLPFALAARFAIFVVVIYCAGLEVFVEQAAFPTAGCGGALDEAFPPLIPTYSVRRCIASSVCEMFVISTGDPKEYSKNIGVT